MNRNFILYLYSRPETVFTVNEVAQFFPNLAYESLRNRLYYFASVGKLKRLRAGIYAKETYDPLELVNKLYTPSYISLETVLSKEGVVFQYYETVFAISYVTREVILENVTIQYRRIKKSILTNAMGVEQKEGYFIASLERAFLDAIYIYKNYHFDNLGGLDWDKIERLKKIYKNKAFEKRVERYYNEAMNQNQKKRLFNKTIKEIISSLRPYRPEKIILFGSAVGGELGADSDIDLLVIKETDEPWWERQKKVSLLYKGLVPTDIFVVTPNELERTVAENRFFVTEEILKKGKVIYEKHRQALSS